MSLFQCVTCGARENTALGKYWGAEKKECSLCAFGEWHGSFPYLKLPQGEFSTDPRGNLMHTASGLPLSEWLEKQDRPNDH